MLNREQKFLIANLALIQFNHIVDFMILMPLGDLLMKLFHISPSQFGLLVSSYTFCAAISSLFAALFVDRFDRKSSLLLFFMGFTVGTIACAFAPNYHFLLIARSVAGFFGGVLTSFVMSIISDAVPYKNRGTAMGFLMTAFSFASIAGVPFSLFLADKFSWHAPFLFLGAVCVINLIMIWWRIPSMRGHLSKTPPPHPLRGLLEHLTHKQSVIPLVFAFFLVLGQFTVIPFISPSLVANVGFTQSQLPLVYLVGGAISLATSPFIGYLSDRVGKHKIFWLANFLCIAPILILTGYTSPQPLVGVLVVVAFFFMFVGGRMNPAMAMVSGSVAPSRRGSFMSLVSSSQQLASAVASYIAGVIIVRSETTGRLENYHFVGYLAVLFSFIAFILSFKVKNVDTAVVPISDVQTPVPTK